MKAEEVKSVHKSLNAKMQALKEEHAEEVESLKRDLAKKSSSSAESGQEIVKLTNENSALISQVRHTQHDLSEARSEI